MLLVVAQGQPFYQAVLEDVLVNQPPVLCHVQHAVHQENVLVDRAGLVALVDLAANPLIQNKAGQVGEFDLAQTAAHMAIKHIFHDAWPAACGFGMGVEVFVEKLGQKNIAWMGFFGRDWVWL